MATALLDLVFAFLWPIVLIAGICFLAIFALAEKDQMTTVVEKLIPPHGIDEGAKPNRSLGAAGADNSVFLPTSRNGSHLPINKAIGGKHIAARNAHDYSQSGLFGIAPFALGNGIAALLAFELIAATAQPAYAEKFEFDQRRTEVRFAYKMAYSTQRGRFTKVRGTLEYDQAAPENTKVSAAINAASLTTGEPLVDSELKGVSFFNVEKSPVIAFNSLKVLPTSGTAADVSGEITVNGITKPVTLKVSLEPHDDPALKYDTGSHRFVATTRINRSAFNMTGYQMMVEDVVEIEIDAIVRPR